MVFEIGKEYKRKLDIHGKYGGQGGGGISTPKNFPVVFIFTSQSGEEHGYRDEYRNDGVFWYTGEGQTGDMKMVVGNKAIRDHKENNKTIHVFESTKKSYVRYLGTAECLGFHEEVRPDTNGDERNAFIFHLDINSIEAENEIKEPRSDYDSGKKNDVKTLKNKSLKELRKAALHKAPSNSKPKEKRESAHYRSEALKLYVLARSKGICEGCNAEAPFKTRKGPFLECHHVHRLADGGPDHPKNVVALCPNCHRRAHYAIDSTAYNEKLKLVASSAEENAM